jgi:hypothetical protein
LQQRWNGGGPRFSSNARNLKRFWDRETPWQPIQVPL